MQREMITRKDGPMSEIFYEIRGCLTSLWVSARARGALFFRLLLTLRARATMTSQRASSIFHIFFSPPALSPRLIN